MGKIKLILELIIFTPNHNMKITSIFLKLMIYTPIHKMSFTPNHKMKIFQGQISLQKYTIKILFLEVDGILTKSQEKHYKHFLELDDLQTKSQVMDNRHILKDDDLHIKSNGDNNKYILEFNDLHTKSQEEVVIFLNFLIFTSNKVMKTMKNQKRTLQLNSISHAFIFL